MVGTAFAINFRHSILTEKQRLDHAEHRARGPNPEVGMMAGTDEPLEREEINIDQELKSLAEVEKSHIRQVLAQTSSMEEAARILGIDPATLWRKRKRYQLD